MQGFTDSLSPAASTMVIAAAAHRSLVSAHHPVNGRCKTELDEDPTRTVTELDDREPATLSWAHRYNNERLHG